MLKPTSQQANRSFYHNVVRSINFILAGYRLHLLDLAHRQNGTVNSLIDVKRNLLMTFEPTISLVRCQGEVVGHRITSRIPMVPCHSLVVVCGTGIDTVCKCVYVDAH